jgi:hypothetical protein
MAYFYSFFLVNLSAGTRLLLLLPGDASATAATSSWQAWRMAMANTFAIGFRQQGLCLLDSNPPTYLYDEADKCI